MKSDKRPHERNVRVVMKWSGAARRVARTSYIPLLLKGTRDEAEVLPDVSDFLSRKCVIKDKHEQIVSIDRQFSFESYKQHR